MFLQCPAVLSLRVKLFPYVEVFDKKDWIFGKSKDIEMTQLIWVLNFAVYKVHLITTSSKKIPLEDQMRLVCKSFSSWLGCLGDME